MLRLVLASAVLFIVAFAHAPGAEAAFAPTNDEIVTAEGLAATGIATDPQGNSIVVWSQRPNPESIFEAKARRLDAGGSLGPVIDLDPGVYSYRPKVAMAASGRAFAAWRTEIEDGDPQGVRGRWIEPDGSLGPLLTLVEGSAEVNSGEVHVVVDPAGVATVAWGNQNGNEIVVRRVRPDGTLGTLVPDISEGGGATNPEIAALPNGDTVAVWRGTGVEKNVLTTGLAFGVPEKISGAGTVADPKIAIDSVGNGLVVWKANEGEDDSVRGRRLGSTGAVVGPELVIDANQDPFVSPIVEVSADTQSDFLVTWTRQDAEGDSILYARGVDFAAEEFAGPAQPLSDDGSEARNQSAALEDTGTRPVIWARWVGEVRATMGVILNPLAAPTSGIQEFLPDDTNDTSVASAPAAGFAAFMIEYAITGSARGAVVRRYMLPPTCGESIATVVQGKPIEAPLACTGLAIEGAQVVTPPAHGQVGGFKPGPALEYTPTPGFEGIDSFTYTAANDGGASNVARVAINVGRDTVDPKIESFRVRSVKKRPVNASAKKKEKRRIYKFLLRFSEPARVRVRVDRRIRGTRKGKRCHKAGKGSRGKRCTFHRLIGAASSTTDLKSVTLTAPRKLGKRLAKGGRFRARAVATDPAGNRSKPKTVNFRVKKRLRR